MHIEYLREFCAFARVLNYTKAAAQLCMAQSTLSRHVKAMEAELGFPLVIERNNELSITHEGRVLLDELLRLLGSFDSVVSGCRLSFRTKTQEIVVCDGIYHDEAFGFCCSCLDGFANRNPGTQVTYVQPIFGRPTLAILNGEIDWFFEYRFKDLEEIAEEYEKMGLACTHMCEARLQVWHSERSPLASLPDDYVVTMRDLASYRIWSFFTEFAPVRKAIDELFGAYGGRANYLNYISRNTAAFFMQPLEENDVYLLPVGVEGNTAIETRSDLAAPKWFERTVHVVGVHAPSRSHATLVRLLSYVEACVKDARGKVPVCIERPGKREAVLGERSASAGCSYGFEEVCPPE